MCLPVTIVSPAKTAEQIGMPFAMWTRVGPRKHVLHEELEMWANAKPDGRPAEYR